MKNRRIQQPPSLIGYGEPREQPERLQTNAGGYCLHPRDFELLADAACGSFFDFPMPRHAGNLAIAGVQPDGVSTPFAVKNAAVTPQMPLQPGQLHASANSIGSRRALGERSFSASSRWHCSTSLSASNRLAFASASVSPCEIAAGTSSTKQVYPPSLAGSKIAVNFRSRRYRTALPLASLRQERFAHAEHRLLITPSTSPLPLPARDLLEPPLQSEKDTSANSVSSG